ncbi:uncharacterized protein LOC123532281 [Mercenaria mercenaria]|uniref:uncharacterized protein LOC123532281 n=1 Tax=Mercenaria mercenaria TaxID=6596 RepID=UPI00234EA9AA|nr:uncharacterized protein LOC123532281 [Mercenaria mercenaria]
MVAKVFCVTVVVVFFLSARAEADNEPSACKLSTEEQLLDKVIRTEVKVEAMLSEIRKTEENVLSVLEYRKQDVQKTLTELKETNAAEIGQIKGKMESVVKGNSAKMDIGSSYVRWGRTTCPDDNELVYKGYAAGSSYTSKGGAANYICLTEEPQWGFYEESVAAGTQVHGGEYELGDHHADGGSKYFKKNLNDQDAPCSLCRTPRSSVTMIPGRLECFSGWTKEYSGYLAAGASGHASATEFICLDSDAEMISGGAANRDGRLFYLAEVSCGSLQCPPYIEGRELTCVVCSK